MNDELRARGDELNDVNDFLNSVLASQRGAVAVVDRDLKVLVWNYRAEDLWGLRSDEVEGTHFLNLDIGLPVEQLRSVIRACIGGDADCAPVTLAATNRRGKAIEV